MDKLTKEDILILLEWAKDTTLTINSSNLLWLETNPEGGVCTTCCYGISSGHQDVDYDNQKEHAPDCLLVKVVKLLERYDKE